MHYLSGGHISRSLPLRAVPVSEMDWVTKVHGDCSGWNSDAEHTLTKQLSDAAPVPACGNRAVKRLGRETSLPERRSTSSAVLACHWSPSPAQVECAHTPIGYKVGHVTCVWVMIPGPTRLDYFILFKGSSFVHQSECFACMCVCTTRERCLWKPEERVGYLELELQMIVRRHVGAGNWSLVHRENS